MKSKREESLLVTVCRGPQSQLELVSAAGGQPSDGNDEIDMALVTLKQAEAKKKWADQVSDYAKEIHPSIEAAKEFSELQPNLV